MKALLALLFGISIVSISIYLHIEKKVDAKSMSAMFALAIIGGLAIANFDVLKRWKGLGIEVETARNEIQGIKADALTDIKTQVEDHKNAISVLMGSASNLSDNLEKQRSLAEALVAKAEGLESEIEKDQKQLKSVKAFQIFPQLIDSHTVNAGGSFVGTQPFPRPVNVIAFKNHLH